MSESTTTPPAPDPRDQLGKKAIAMRRAGASFASIAEALRISRSAARRLILREGKSLDRDTKTLAGVALALELDQLDAGTRVAFAAMNNTELSVTQRLRALDRLLAISDRRSRLLGLNAPSKVAITDPDDELIPSPVTDEERAKRIIELLSRGGEAPAGEPTSEPE